MLYNYALEYLSGLIVLRLRGIRPFLDIEDAPRCDEPGPQALLARLLFLPFFHLSDRRKLTASQHVATRLAIPDACTVYGVKRYTQKDLVTSGIDAWRQVKEGAPLRIHFGGTLSVDSGLLLFCDAVRVLLASMETGEGRIAFLVTGNGGEQELTALQECCKGSPVTIEWRSNLDRETFIIEFQKCHAALSLNLPGTSLEETTFPSKVVEITGNGLLLISTRASDIPLIFDDSNAILLDAASASHLAERIRSMLADPEGMRLLDVSSSPQSPFSGTVTRCTFLGSIVEYEVSLEGLPSLLVQTPNPLGGRIHGVGSSVGVDFIPGALHVLAS